MSASLLPSTIARPLRIACLGDSITEGTVFAVADRAQVTWPAVLQGCLGSTAVVGNFGRGGATVITAGDTPYPGSPQHGDARAFAPDLVVILLGTNDARSANAAKRGDFAGDLTALGREFAALPSHPRIVLGTPLPAFRANHTVEPAAIAELIAPAVRAVAAAEGWGLIDLNRELADLGPSCADGIHPDIAGTARLATSILAHLRRLPA